MTLTTTLAQTPMSFTYQAVVRNSSGQLVSNATVGVRISIIQGSLNGRAVYNSTQTATTNANGLLTIIIGNGQNPIDTINWANGPYYLKSEVDPAGGANYTLSTVQQMLSVPYALHAHTVDNANFVEQQVLTMSGDTVSLTGGSFVVLPPSFSGVYDSLTNKPVLFSGVYDSLTNKPVLFSGVYDSLTNKPVLFSGDYDSLTNKPVLFSGVYDSLTNKPTNVSAFTNDAGYLTSYTETQVLSKRGDTVFLTGGSFVVLPAGFSGNYNDLTNKPHLFSGVYDSLTNKPVLFSGVYDSLTNKPTNVSTFSNDAGYLTNATLTERQKLSDVARLNDSVNSQIKNLYDPTDSMDAVNLRTLNVVISRYDSIINHLLNIIDTLQNPVIPTVVTVSISNVTATTATANGNVTSNGGDMVTARGVCWSTSHNPTISDSHTTNSTGTGSFTSSISGLTVGTTYYVRAYATNSVGTAYGNELSLNSTAVIPTVTTTVASNITASAATSGGNVTNDGGATVSARGVCWSTSHNPTISDSHTTNDTGAGNFTSSLTGLASNTTYYVRAYATNSVGTAYGEERSFSTTEPTLRTPTISVERLPNGGNNNHYNFTIETRGVSGVTYYIKQYAGDNYTCSNTINPSTSSYTERRTGTGANSTITFSWTSNTPVVVLKVIGTKRGYNNSAVQCYIGYWE